MWDEEIGMLDTAPEVIPDLSLRRTLNVNEVTANLCSNNRSIVDSSAHDQQRPGAYLDMGTIDNWNVWSGLLDERNEPWHLRVVDEDDICATSALGKHIWIIKQGTKDEEAHKRSTFREPVALGVVGDPLGELLLLREGQSEVGISDTLEDVMVVLGGPEHCRRGRGNVLDVKVLFVPARAGGQTHPFSIDAEQAEKANKSVTHQCNTSALGSGAEESYFDLLLAKDLGVFVDRVPRWLADGRAIVLQRVNDTNASASIDVHFVPKLNKEEVWPRTNRSKTSKAHLKPMKRRGLWPEGPK
jgi:hypothetical protein